SVRISHKVTLCIQIADADNVRKIFCHAGSKDCVDLLKAVCLSHFHKVYGNAVIQLVRFFHSKTVERLVPCPYGDLCAAVLSSHYIYTAQCSCCHSCGHCDCQNSFFHFVSSF